MKTIDMNKMENYVSPEAVVLIISLKNHILQGSNTEDQGEGGQHPWNP